MEATKNRVEQEQPLPLWLTYKEAERLYALSRTTLRALVADGTIKARNVGRAVRINRASLDAYMHDESGE